MKRYGLMISLLLLLLSFTGCGNIKMKKGAEEYIGSNYEEVVAEFNQLGFSNIETLEIADLTSSDKMPDGTVGEVSMDGNTNFTSNEAFPKDTEVIITYHIIRKISSPIAPNQICDMDSTAVAEAFTNAGFANVQITESYDLDPDETNEEYQNEVKVNDITLSNNSDTFPFDAIVEVVCHYPYEKYDVQLKVDFVGNLIFSKYDVDLLIDGNKQDTLKHGKDWERALRLRKGEHTITFANAGDSSVNGEVVLDITCKTEGEYRIFCYNDEVTVETVYLNREVELADNQVKILCSESNYLGKNYKEVEAELAELGFNNIKTVPAYDIFFGITEKESISDVSINGSDDFKRGDIFMNDIEVRITYHMPYEDEPKSESAGIENEPKSESAGTENEDDGDISDTDMSETEYTKMNEMVTDCSCAYVRDLMKELGYNAEYEYETTHMDATGDISYYTDEELESIGFIITGIKTMDSGKKTITLYVNTTENIERINTQKDQKADLEENFDPTIALSALEQYGKSQYPYGFSIKMVTGKLAETAIDENTWFMKYTCKVTNAAGQKATMTCEAKIKGPESNPTVYDFLVY